MLHCFEYTEKNLYGMFNSLFFNFPLHLLLPVSEKWDKYLFRVFGSLESSFHIFFTSACLRQSLCLLSCLHLPHLCLSPEWCNYTVCSSVSALMASVDRVGKLFVCVCEPDDLLNHLQNDSIVLSHEFMFFLSRNDLCFHLSFLCLPTLENIARSCSLPA